MKFQRGMNPKKALGIGKSVLDYLKEHPICNPMNDPENDVKDPRDPNLKVWINPHNQTCFNSAWCSPKDLQDWMMGTGIMVKGKNPTQKKKFWKYAVLEAEDNNHIMWSILYHYKDFEKFSTDFNPHNHKGWGMETQIRKPIKMRANPLRDSLEEKIRQEKIIIDMFAPFVDEIYRELEYREWQNIRHSYDKEFYGVKRTLYCLGVGYFGACNTPEEIENLSWVTDIVYAKAYYKHMVERLKLEMPDFNFINNHRYD